MRPALKGIQAEAAAGLFPGSESLARQPALCGAADAPARPRTGGVIGDETDNLTARMTTPGRLADFEGSGT
jgi:hypothetical protein